MTIIRPKELREFMRRDFASFQGLLLYGADEGGIRELSLQIARRVLGASAFPANHIVFSGDALADNPELFIEEINTYAFFPGTKVVRVQGASRLPPSAIPEEGDMPDKRCFMIFECGPLKPSSPLRRLCEKHARIAVVSRYPDTNQALSELIRELATTTGKVLTPEAHDMLLSALGVDHALSRMEIEKLLIYAGDSKTITADMVAASVVNASKEDSRQLIDAVFTGMTREASRKAAYLFQAGTTAAAILSQTLTHAFSLRRALVIVQEGASRALAVKQANLHFSRAAHFEKALSLWNLAMLDSGISYLFLSLHQTRLHHELAPLLCLRSLWRLSQMVRKK